MTVTQRDGVLTIANNRLHFTPEVYPTEHLRNEGWRKEPDGSWSAPLAVDYARQLRVLFPGVVGDDRFLQWYATPTQPSSVSLLHAGKPDSWDRLYPYQQRAAQWLSERRSAMLCLAPGQGKSAVALTAAQMAGTLSTTVVCPLTLLGTWQEQIAQWWPQAKVHVFREHHTSRDNTEYRLTPNAPDIYLLTYDRLRRSGLPLRSHLLIFDESVLLKNRQARRAKAAMLARKQVHSCWLLSGSPTTRFYDDLWSQLHTLEPKQYPSYWRFARSYTLIKDSVWGKSVVANVPNVEPTLKRDLAPLMLTYNYADLAREEPERAIPEWVFETRHVPLPEKWWHLYKQMQDKFMADLPDGTRILAPNTLARLVRLLQFASHPALLATTVVGTTGRQDFGGEPDEWKFRDVQAQHPALLMGQTVNPCQYCRGTGWVDFVGGDGLTYENTEECTVCLASVLTQDFAGYDWSAKGGKLSVIPELLDELPGPTIVWTNFIATAKHLSETLKAPCLIGETPAEERIHIVAEFQAGQHPVLIAHPGVGRFGLTLTRARSAIYAERSYDGDAWTQSLYRLRRIGTKEPPQIVVLEATGPEGQRTVDALIARTLGYRLQKSIEITTADVREVLRDVR